MSDHYGALGIKELKCQIYLKAVTYTNTDETRLWKEQMKYLYKRDQQQGTGSVLTSFEPITIEYQINQMQAV